jgi:hypothetical protein
VLVPILQAWGSGAGGQISARGKNGAKDYKNKFRSGRKRSADQGCAARRRTLSMAWRPYGMPDMVEVAGAR